MAGALQTRFSEVHASTKVDFDIQEAISELIKNDKSITNPVLAFIHTADMFTSGSLSMLCPQKS